MALHLSTGHVAAKLERLPPSNAAAARAPPATEQQLGKVSRGSQRCLIVETEQPLETCVNYVTAPGRPRREQIPLRAAPTAALVYSQPPTGAEVRAGDAI